jgi:hypothetical protein
VTLGTNPDVVGGKISTMDRRVNDTMKRFRAARGRPPRGHGTGSSGAESRPASMGIVAIARALPARTPGVSLGEHN